MEIPELLKGEPHLPLMEMQTLSEVLPVANAFYQTRFTMEDFKDAQVFKDPNGRLILEALDKSTGEVLIRFVNRNADPIKVEDSLTVDNPLFSSHNWMGPPVKVEHEAELSFLDAVGSGNTYTTLADNTLAWQLSNLLNEYNAVGHWKASTFAAYSTAGFEIVYKGPGQDVPPEYLVGEADQVVILRFHHGNNKGMLCLKS